MGINVLDKQVIARQWLVFRIGGFIDLFEIILIAACIQVVVSIVLFNCEFVLACRLGQEPFRWLLHLLFVNVWIGCCHWAFRQIRLDIDNVILITLV